MSKKDQEGQGQVSEHSLARSRGGRLWHGAPGSLETARSLPPRAQGLAGTPHAIGHRFRLPPQGDENPQMPLLCVRRGSCSEARGPLADEEPQAQAVGRTGTEGAQLGQDPRAVGRAAAGPETGLGSCLSPGFSPTHPSFRYGVPQMSPAPSTDNHLPSPLVTLFHLPLL